MAIKHNSIDWNLAVAVGIGVLVAGAFVSHTVRAHTLPNIYCPHGQIFCASNQSCINSADFMLACPGVSNF